MTMTTDHRYVLLRADDWIPLPFAHHVVGKGKSTVYRWAQAGRLKLIETGDGTVVQVGSLRAAEATMKPGRKFAKRLHKSTGEFDTPAQPGTQSETL